MIEATSRWVRAWSTILFIGAGIVPSASAAGGAVTICDLVRHSERYRDKVVTVSGYFLHGPHGATLATEDCGFRSRYAAFGRGVAADFEYYSPSSRLPKDAVRQVDEASIHRFDSMLSPPKAPQNRDIEITVLAFVKVAEHYRISDSGGGNYAGTGFGFMGRYPVQLVVLKVVDFNVLPEAAK